MLHGSQGVCGTVLPEISGVSIAHEPLLQTARHARQLSSEEGRKKGAGQGMGDRPHPLGAWPSALRPPPSPLPGQVDIRDQEMRGDSLVQTSRGGGNTVLCCV